MPETPDQDLWPQGFDGHRRAQMRRTAQWSFERKLDWLEETARFARELRPIESIEPQRRGDAEKKEEEGA